MGAKVEVEAGALPVIGFRETAQHTDGGHLSQTLRFHKASHLAIRHGEVDMADRRLFAKALGEALYIDGKLRRNQSGRTFAG
jgi:hypothetical protein